MILEELLNKVDDSQLLWVSPERQITAGELKRDIVACRKLFPLTDKPRVALELSDSVSALTWMLALDGFSEVVFLVPASLQKSNDYVHLKRQFQANLTVSESLDCKVRVPAKEEYVDGNPTPAVRYATRWVLATSGTTGIPKLIEHSTDSLTKTCKVDVSRGKDFIWGLVFDPFRFAGLQVVLQALSSGSKLVLCNRIESFSGQVNFFRDSHANALSATPTYWRKLLMSGALQGHVFRQVTLGGEPADRSVLNALKSAFPSARVAHIYASTEAGVGFSVTDGLPGFPQRYLDEGIAGNKLRISDSGTLLVKPEKHTPVISGGASLTNAEGFVDTGDLVEIRGGRVHFLGRDSGTINVGGNKVIPEEVESVIREVEGVGEVIVKPKSSGVMGELVTAEIQILSSVSDKAVFKNAIIAHCRRRLEKHKVPALIWFVAEIEHNSTGKINRT
ncbi:o-succinylbenzoate--CoA ligase [Reinekea forsetii]|uniref:O-succinylbenzoate--CoA ligase n=1 Tax=Reinekea forsetii TaxID=1336806 RepID=A0A2K8KRV7_9GAMM|nr:o-succinylbenzoate--CoA ligase [Reinekea forsetii]